MSTATSSSCRIRRAAATRPHASSGSTPSNTIVAATINMLLNGGRQDDPEPAAGEVVLKVRATAVNRADLMQRTGCRDVKFTVYVKDGKAALKATPIKG